MSNSDKLKSITDILSSLDYVNDNSCDCEICSTLKSMPWLLRSEAVRLCQSELGADDWIICYNV